MKKPYEWDGMFCGFTVEESKLAWNNVWEFIFKIDWERELSEYSDIVRKAKLDLYKFMKFCEEKHQYQDEVFESIFDGISVDEFSTFLQENLKTIKCTEETTTTTYAEIKKEN